MERQLALLEVPSDWKLDDETREIARRGVAEARQALREARRRAEQRALANADAA